MRLMFKKSAMMLMMTVLAFASLAQAAAPERVEGATTVNTAEAKKLWDAGATFIDSRKKEDWENGHIPNAIHLDRGDREVYTRENVSKMFKKNEPLVTYCYGKVCTRSSQMAADLVSLGYTKVYFYREGFPEWSFAGHPIESK